MLKINFKSETKKLICEIVRDLFLATLALFAIFSGLEIIKPRIVLNYINLDIFLLVLIVLGIFTIVIYQPQLKGMVKVKFWSNLLILLLAIIIGIVVVYMAKSLGYLSILVGLATAIISYYFIILCLEE